MSQHRFMTQYQGFPVEILMGWDRPLHGYFLSVLRLDAPEDEDEIVYDDFRNLQQLTPWLKKLAELGLSIPEEMAKAVFTDGLLQTGNFMKDWTGLATSDMPAMIKAMASLENVSV